MLRMTRVRERRMGIALFGSFATTRVNLLRLTTPTTLLLAILRLMDYVLFIALYDTST